MEENRTLSMERSYLADLMSNVQKMHNDLERSGENDRRRLEGQLQMLDNQTSVGDFKHFFESNILQINSQDLRSQLLQERESVRHISLQKDIELKELQTRIEKSVRTALKKRSWLIYNFHSQTNFPKHVKHLWKLRQVENISKRRLRI